MTPEKLLDAMARRLCKRCAHPIDVHSKANYCGFKIPHGYRCNCGGTGEESCRSGNYSEGSISSYRLYYNRKDPSSWKTVTREEFFERYGWKEE